MQTIRMTDEQYEQALALGLVKPKKPRAKPVQSVTLDSRFTDCELVALYRTLEDLERHNRWRIKAFLVRFALGTGLRETEITRLRFSLDPNNEDTAECKRNGVITVRNSKGGKSRDARCIPELQPHYEAHIEWMASMHEGAQFGLVPLLGKAYERTTLWRWWVDVLNRCPEVRRLRLHDARHTYCSWELLRLPLAQVKGLVGHSKSSDTFEARYNGVIAELVYGGEVQWYKAALGRFAK